MIDLDKLRDKLRDGYFVRTGTSRTPIGYAAVEHGLETTTASRSLIGAFRLSDTIEDVIERFPAAFYPLEIPRTYYAIPTPYTIGDAFDELDEVLVIAARKIENIREENLEHDLFVPEHVTIDERVRDEYGDRVVRRYTLSCTPDSSEPAGRRELLETFDAHGTE